MDKRSVQVPDIGDFQEVEVIDILVQTGDRIQEEDPLITLESDKASMDVPSPFSGTISSIHLKVGDKISIPIFGKPNASLTPMHFFILLSDLKIFSCDFFLFFSK